MMFEVIVVQLSVYKEKLNCVLTATSKGSWINIIKVSIADKSKQNIYNKI